MGIMGNKPNEPLTFKFTEIPPEEDEAKLLFPEAKEEDSD